MRERITRQKFQVQPRASHSSHYSRPSLLFQTIKARTQVIFADHSALVHRSAIRTGQAHLLVNPMCACKFMTLLQLQRVSVRASEC